MNGLYNGVANSLERAAEALLNLADRVRMKCRYRSAEFTGEVDGGTPECSAYKGVERTINPVWKD